MEISPKLTSAASLNSTVVTKPSPTEVATSSLSQAASNNNNAAADIAKLSTDPKSAAVAEANRESARVDVKDVDNLAKDLSSRVKENPERSLTAVSTSLTNDVVRSLLS
jgi:hypothetical protein